MTVKSGSSILKETPMVPVFKGGQAHERLTAQGARKSNQCDKMFNRTPCTLDRVASAGLPGETVRRMVPFKWLRTNLFAAWKTNSRQGVGSHCASGTSYYHHAPEISLTLLLLTEGSQSRI
jgi:hypothetical protein